MRPEPISGHVTPFDEQNPLTSTRITFGELGQGQIVDLTRSIESIQVGMVHEHPPGVVRVHDGESGRRDRLGDSERPSETLSECRLASSHVTRQHDDVTRPGERGDRRRDLVGAFERRHHARDHTDRYYRGLSFAWDGHRGQHYSRRMTDKMCQDRICVITGAGRGIGREYALMLAAEGAKVVVNDFGGSRDGSGAGGSNPAQEVVDEIVAAGGQAVAHLGDASSLDDAKAMISLAIDTFGGLDVVVNNAGILRDRMLFSMAEEEWDAVIKVHMKGTWASSRVAAEYWRNRSKEGLSNDARLINTTSVSGIYGNPGQTNYGAAKAGIATFTLIAAEELGRYGVTCNAVAPGALTRLTEDLGMPPEMLERFGPEWVAPVITWLASSQSSDVTGQVIESNGQLLAIAQGWIRGPHITNPPIDPHEMDAAIRPLLARATPRTKMSEIN